MDCSKQMLAVMVTLSFVAPRVSTAQPGCTLKLDNLVQNLRSFDRDAVPIGAGFLNGDALTAALNAAKGQLQSLRTSEQQSPTWKGLREAAQAQDELVNFDTQLTSWHEGVVEYRACLKNPGCSIADAIKQQETSNRQLADWLKSLGDEGLAEVTAKVDKAEGILRTFRANVGTTETGTMSQALSCLDQASPRVVQAAGRDSQATSSGTAGAAATPAATPRETEPTPPLAMGYEVGTLDLGPILGLGGTGFYGSNSIGGRIEKAFKQLDNGILGISGSATRWSYDCPGCTFSTTYIAATVNYHFVLKNNRRWDPFLSLGLGYLRYSAGVDDGLFGSNFSDGGVVFAGNAGVRYFITKSMAAYADIGSGAATFNLGLMFKLK